MRLKYIILRIYEFGGNDQEIDRIAILFPDAIPQLTHRDVASMHKAGLRAVISAGFCELHLDTKTVDVFGTSETLHMNAQPEDGPIIAKLFGW